MMTVPNGLPILSRGSYDRASGKACIMNAISYLNGDIEITDAPNCVAEPLRHLFIQINDRICYGGLGESQQDELCPKCSHLMWLYGARIIGSAEAYRDLSSDERRALVMEMCRVLIERLVPDKFVDDQLAWLDVMNGRGHGPVMLISDIGDKITRYLLDMTAVDPTGGGRRDLARQIMKIALDVFDHYTRFVAPAETPTEDQFKTVATEAKVAVYTA